MRLIPKSDEGWTPYAWIVYLTFFVFSPMLIARPRAIDWVISIAGTIVFLALYFRGYWVRGRDIVPIIAGIALLGIVFLPFNVSAGVFFIYAAAFASRLDHDRAAIGVIAALVITLMIEAAVTHIHPLSIAWAVVFTIIVGAINIHYASVGRANKRLRLAQEEIEHLAKVAERERIARDLHDLLGHTLSVIILKSELASKLGERDPERARAEIRDVERISRDALAQVRAAVRGYRSGGLQAELVSAREALRAAGVEVETAVDNVQLPAAHEVVVALAIREAATNVVRHAAAKHCRIALSVAGGVCTVTVSDDGRGGNVPFGDGLTGMRERFEALGGMLTRDGARGTTVTMTMSVGQAILPAGGGQAGVPVPRSA
jgi:two-component system sensor histidine kinase DesK